MRIRRARDERNRKARCGSWVGQEEKGREMKKKRKEKIGKKSGNTDER